MMNHSMIRERLYNKVIKVKKVNRKNKKADKIKNELNLLIVHYKHNFINW